MPDNVPDWLKPHVLEERQTPVEGINRKYLVVSRNLEPDLPLFVGYNKGLPFVSEEVPEEFRIGWIAHEIIEFEQFRDEDGNWLPDHCRRSLVKEMDYVSQDILSEYLPLRLKFFTDLVYYLIVKGEPIDFIVEVEKSRKGLEEIVKSLED